MAYICRTSQENTRLVKASYSVTLRTVSMLFCTSFWKAKILGQSSFELNMHMLQYAGPRVTYAIFWRCASSQLQARKKYVVLKITIPTDLVTALPEQDDQWLPWRENVPFLGCRKCIVKDVTKLIPPEARRCCPMPKKYRGDGRNNE